MKLIDVLQYYLVQMDLEKLCCWNVLMLLVKVICLSF